MLVDRRTFLRAAVGIFAPFELLAAPARQQVKITAVKALQLAGQPATILRIDTDAGISGYGPAHGTGPYVREAIAWALTASTGQPDSISSVTTPAK